MTLAPALVPTLFLTLVPILTLAPASAPGPFKILFPVLAQAPGPGFGCGPGFDSGLVPTPIPDSMLGPVWTPALV